MRYTPKQIGSFIRKIRKELGVTQRSLALTSGTGLRFLVELEKGKETCELGKVLAVLRSLGVELRLVPPGSLESGD